jgi:acyl-CoA thioester hydrolase
MQVGPTLGSIHCKLKMPLTYPDTVSVGTRVTRIEEDRFVMEYAVVSHQARRAAAEGERVVVAYNCLEGKKALLPEEVAKECIRKLEALVQQGSSFTKSAQVL